MKIKWQFLILLLPLFFYIGYSKFCLEEDHPLGITLKGKCGNFSLGLEDGQTYPPYTMCGWEIDTGFTTPVNLALECRWDRPDAFHYYNLPKRSVPCVKDYGVTKYPARDTLYIYDSADVMQKSLEASQMHDIEFNNQFWDEDKQEFIPGRITFSLFSEYGKFYLKFASYDDSVSEDYESAANAGGTGFTCEWTVIQPTETEETKICYQETEDNTCDTCSIDNCCKCANSVCTKCDEGFILAADIFGDYTCQVPLFEVEYYCYNSFTEPGADWRYLQAPDSVRYQNEMAFDVYCGDEHVGVPNHFTKYVLIYAHFKGRININIQGSYYFYHTVNGDGYFDTSYYKVFIDGEECHSDFCFMSSGLKNFDFFVYWGADDDLDTNIDLYYSDDNNDFLVPTSWYEPTNFIHPRPKGCGWVNAFGVCGNCIGSFDYFNDANLVNNYNMYYLDNGEPYFDYERDEYDPYTKKGICIEACSIHNGVPQHYTDPIGYFSAGDQESRNGFARSTNITCSWVLDAPGADFYMLVPARRELAGGFKLEMYCENTLIYSWDENTDIGFQGNFLTDIENFIQNNFFFLLPCANPVIKYIPPGIEKNLGPGYSDFIYNNVDSTSGFVWTYYSLTTQNCPAGCKACNTTGTCFWCEDGYSFSPFAPPWSEGYSCTPSFSCGLNPNNCETCNENGDCISCPDGYALNNNHTGFEGAACFLKPYGCVEFGQKYTIPAVSKDSTSEVANHWIDILETGTQVCQNAGQFDICNYRVTIPFTYKIFNKAFSSIFINSNGFVSLGVPIESNCPDNSVDIDFIVAETFLTANCFDSFVDNTIGGVFFTADSDKIVITFNERQLQNEIFVRYGETPTPYTKQIQIHKDGTLFTLTKQFDDIQWEYPLQLYPQQFYVKQDILSVDFDNSGKNAAFVTFDTNSWLDSYIKSLNDQDFCIGCPSDSHCQKCAAGSGACYQCHPGYYLTGEQYIKDTKCALCTDSPNKCGNQCDNSVVIGGCINCPQPTPGNFIYLNNNECITVVLDPNCLNIDGTGTCIECNPNFSFNDGVCTQCPDVNADDCTFPQGDSISCLLPNFYIKTDTCIDASLEPSFCSSLEINNDCATCPTGRFKNETESGVIVCDLCPSQLECFDCDADGCTECSIGFMKVIDTPNYCFECGHNCNTCTQDEKACITCPENYYLSGAAGIDGTTCVNCDQNGCADCVEATGVCTLCKTNYRFDDVTGSTCVPCSPDCTSCNPNTGDCLSCKTNFIPFEGKCYQEPTTTPSYSFNSLCGTGDIVINQPVDNSIFFTTSCFSSSWFPKNYHGSGFTKEQNYVIVDLGNSYFIESIHSYSGPNAIDHPFIAYLLAANQSIWGDQREIAYTILTDAVTDSTMSIYDGEGFVARYLLLYFAKQNPSFSLSDCSTLTMDQLQSPNSDYMRIFNLDINYFSTCLDGHQNGDETGVDCGGSCISCQTVTDKYCLTHNGLTGGCITCPTGYGIVGAPGDEDTFCNPCPVGGNCVECNALDQCTSCPFGYGLASICLPCIDNCEQCEMLTGGCEVCSDGYYLSGLPGEIGTICKKCDKRLNCRTCNNYNMVENAVEISEGEHDFCTECNDSDQIMHYGDFAEGELVVYKMLNIPPTTMCANYCDKKNLSYTAQQDYFNAFLVNKQYGLENVHCQFMIEPNQPRDYIVLDLQAYSFVENKDFFWVMDGTKYDFNSPWYETPHIFQITGEAMPAFLKKTFNLPKLLIRTFSGRKNMANYPFPSPSLFYGSYYTTDDKPQPVTSFVISETPTTPTTPSTVSLSWTPDSNIGDCKSQGWDIRYESPSFGKDGFCGIPFTDIEELPHVPPTCESTITSLFTSKPQTQYNYYYYTSFTDNCPCADNSCHITCIATECSQFDDYIYHDIGKLKYQFCYYHIEENSACQASSCSSNGFGITPTLDHHLGGCGSSLNQDPNLYTFRSYLPNFICRDKTKYPDCVTSLYSHQQCSLTNIPPGSKLQYAITSNCSNVPYETLKDDTVLSNIITTEVVRGSTPIVTVTQNNPLVDTATFSWTMANPNHCEIDYVNIASIGSNTLNLNECDEVLTNVQECSEPSINYNTEYSIELTIFCKNRLADPLLKGTATFSIHQGAEAVVIIPDILTNTTYSFHWDTPAENECGSPYYDLQQVLPTPGTPNVLCDLNSFSTIECELYALTPRIDYTFTLQVKCSDSFLDSPLTNINITPLPVLPMSPILELDDDHTKTTLESVNLLVVPQKLNDCEFVCYEVYIDLETITGCSCNELTSLESSYCFIDGLSSGENVDVTVKQFCMYEEESAMSGEFSFQSLYVSDAPTLNPATLGSDPRTDINFNWVKPNFKGCVFDHYEFDITSWFVLDATAPLFTSFTYSCNLDNSDTITCNDVSGFKPGVSFGFRMRVVCENSYANSIWSNTITIDTDATIASPATIEVDTESVLSKELDLTFSKNTLNDCEFKCFEIFEGVNPITGCGCDDLGTDSTQCQVSNLTPASLYLFNIFIKCHNPGADSLVASDSATTFSIAGTPNFVSILVGDPFTSNIIIDWNAGLENGCIFDKWILSFVVTDPDKTVGEVPDSLYNTTEIEFNPQYRLNTSVVLQDLYPGYGYTFTIQETCTNTFKNSDVSPISTIYHVPSIPADNSEFHVNESSIYHTTETLEFYWIMGEENSCIFKCFEVIQVSPANGLQSPTGCGCGDLGDENKWNCVATGFDPRQPYSFKMYTRCYNEGADSIESNTDSTTTHYESDAPSYSLALGTPNNRVVQISWTVPETYSCDFDHYEIRFLQGETINHDTIIDVDCNLNIKETDSCNILGLHYLTLFQFEMKVFCKNTISNSKWTETNPTIMTKQWKAAKPQLTTISQMTTTSSIHFVVLPAAINDCEFSCWKLVFYGTDTSPDGCGCDVLNDVGAVTCNAVNLTPGSFYSFTVQAICDNPIASSDISYPELSVLLKRPANPPYNINLEQVTNSTLKLSWTKNFEFSCVFTDWLIVFEKGSTGVVDRFNPPCNLKNQYTSHCYITELLPETDYSFKVKERCKIWWTNSDFSIESPIIQTSVLPANPPVVTIPESGITDTSAVVEWSPGDPRECFFKEWEVWIATNAGTSTGCGTYSSYSAYTCEFTGMIPYNIYRISVQQKCLYDSSNSPIGNSRTFMTKLKSEPLSGFTITGIHSRSFDAVWEVPSTINNCQFSSYTVWINGNPNDIGCSVSDPSATGCVIHGLEPLQSYTFDLGVTCSNSWGNSDVVTSETFSTLSIADAPINFLASNTLKTTRTVPLSWDKGTNDGECTPSGYEVRVGNELASGCEGLTLTQTSCTVTGLEPNTLYTFSVRMICSNIESTAYSPDTTTSMTTFNIAGPPVNLQTDAVAKTRTSIPLTWDAGTQTGDCIPAGFTVVFSGGDYHEEAVCTISTYSATDNGCILTQLIEDTIYQFKVKQLCSDPDRNSDYSLPSAPLSTPSDSSLAARPRLLEVDHDDRFDDHATLSWVFTNADLSECDFSHYIVSLASSTSIITDTIIGTCQEGNAALDVIATQECEVEELVPDSYTFAVQVVCHNGYASSLMSQPSSLFSRADPELLKKIESDSRTDAENLTIGSISGVIGFVVVASVVLLVYLKCKGGNNIAAISPDVELAPTQ